MIHNHHFFKLLNMSNNYLNYSIGDRKTIEKIMTVKQWNAECRPEEKINVKYGYVMPIFHGYDWKPSKQQLINKYTFGPNTRTFNINDADSNYNLCKQI